MWVQSSILVSVSKGLKILETYLQYASRISFWTFRVVLGWAYRGLTGGFLLLQNFCVAISVSPHVCFILVLILISMFLR